MKTDEDGKPAQIFCDMFLTEIRKEASIELSYFRFGELEEKLSCVGYRVIDNPWDNVKKIFLVTRKYYTKNKINTIFAIVRDKISINYRNKIKHHIHDEYIEITNNNNVKIINYEINLPFNISKRRIDQSHQLIETIERIDDDASPTGEYLKLFIREVPPKQVDQPGKVKIPLISPS